MKVTRRATQKINKCKKVYLVVCYAKWTVREFPWTGKFTTYRGNPCPLVWDYDDHNGTYEEYVKRPIYHTTTGWICTWCFDKSASQRIANALQFFNEKSN